MEILLGGKKYPGLIATCEFAELAAFRYFPTKGGRGGNTFYATRNVRRTDGSWTMRKLHQDVMELAGIAVPPGMMIDHIDGVGTNCLLSNLRLATNAQNSMNQRSHRDSSSRYLGVSWYSRDGKWKSQIRIGGKSTHLGYFDSEFDAARAYDIVAHYEHGLFANLNFPEAA